MASNPHGFGNEAEISLYLNNKKYSDLNLSMKEFINYICKTKGLVYNKNTLITSTVETNNKYKQDIYIEINNNRFGISIKMGSGNSVHQEKIEDFISFIKQNCNATDRICDLWRFFIWADGTLDGNGSLIKGADGKIKSRFDSNGFKKKFPTERKELQEFIESNKKVLIERAIFVGKYNSVVDFIYHGTYRQGQWISKDEVLEFLLRKPASARACFPVGGLTIQAWNVSLKGGTEEKRGQIQLKYGSLQDDLDILMRNNSSEIGTFFGDVEEFGLSHVLNKNKNNSMWRTLIPNESDYSNYYVVKVSSNQFSTLSNQKVKTKSDAFVTKATFNKDFLLEREYILDESDIKGKEYEIVPDSGISIKMKNSRNYTYQKLTRNSFVKAFSGIDDVNFWLVSLLIYSADSERYKNEKILHDFNFTLDEFTNTVSQKMEINDLDIHDKVYWDSVRKNAQSYIKNYVLSNDELYENIFTGKHWFSTPYHAMFIFEKGELRKNQLTDFAITTGSGRSKGKYTIEFTPISK